MRSDTTMSRVLDLAGLPREALPRSARSIAGLSLFDWMVVGRAGADEPLSQIVRDMVIGEAGSPVAALIGDVARVPARAAALANGSISHALDYDDTHFAHVGHPSVAVMPAALAIGEQENASAREVCDAFLVGAEASIRIGMVLGRGHYERGFHMTATAGAFGATVAAGRILGLSRDEMRNALGVASTRASGLKSQFGTMGKPFNAGIAASNGVEAALLARRGFVSCDDGIGGMQGFVETHADEPDEAAAGADPPPGRFLFEDVKHKLHAGCHGTHAMIEALVAAREAHDLVPEAVSSIDLRVNPRWLRVCDIKRPRTGLEVKFSYGVLAAMVLSGVSTSADEAFTDDLCADPDLADLARRVRVEGDPSVCDTATRVEITRTSGEPIRVVHDLAARLPMDALERGLRDKARALLGEGVAERLWTGASHLDHRSARDLALLLNG